MAARLRLAFVLLLAVGLALALVGLRRQSRRLVEDQRQKELDRQTIARLQQALRQAGLQPLPAAPEETGPEKEPRIPWAERNAAIARLTRELRESQTDLAAVEAQLAAAQGKRQTAVAQAEERLQKEQREEQNKLDALQQQLEAAEAASEASRQRVSALEAEVDELRADRHQDSARTVQLANTLASLVDLDHRRDVYLTNIMRRYRDITNQYRATSGMLDSTHDPNSNALSSAALSRIQNAVSQTDDDLRQLNELNDQIHQLEKKLAYK